MRFSAKKITSGFILVFSSLKKVVDILAVNSRKFTVNNANPHSFSTRSFPRRENLVKPKIAFNNPNTGSTLFFCRKSYQFLHPKDSHEYMLFAFPTFC